MSEYLELMRSLLESAPNDPVVQRACVAAAELQSANRRTELLQRVAGVANIDPEVRAQVAVDRSEAVRAAVWARTDWDADALSAALDRDFSVPVRRAVIRNGACTRELLERAATPLLKSQAEPVMERCLLASPELLLAAVRLVMDQTKASLSDAKRTRFLNAATQPGVAEHLALAADTPPQLRLLTLQAECLTDAQRLEAVTLLPDQPDADDLDAEQLGSELERAVPIRATWSLTVVKALAAKYQQWVGQASVRLPPALDWAAKSSYDQLAARIQYSYGAAALLKALRTVPPGQLPADLADRIILSVHCTGAVVAEVLPSLPDVDLAALCVRLGAQPDRVGPRRWMTNHPELFLRYAEATQTEYADRTADLTNKHPGLRDQLFARLCAAPERFAAGTRTKLLCKLTLTPEQLGNAPWADLNAAARSEDLDPVRKAAVVTAVIAVLARLDTDDTDRAVRRAQTMSTLVTASAPAAEVSVAATALERV